MSYINKTYKPEEIIILRPLIEEILNLWLKSDKSKPFNDWLIIALHVKGYRIVKTGVK
jgi:hypothetical protein